MQSGTKFLRQSECYPASDLSAGSQYRANFKVSVPIKYLSNFFTIYIAIQIRVLFDNAESAEMFVSHIMSLIDGPSCLKTKKKQDKCKPESKSKGILYLLEVFGLASVPLE